MEEAAATEKAKLTVDKFGIVVIRLVGVRAAGMVFVVPQRNLPKFFGVGYPVSRYEPQDGKGDVRIYRYVTVN